MKVAIEVLFFLFSVMEATNGLRLVIEPNTTFIEAGKSFNLTCQDENNILSVIFKHNVMSDSNNSFYYVKNASVSDSGSYSCSNSSLSPTLNITVIEVPKPVLLLNTTSVMSGSNRTAKCFISLQNFSSIAILYTFFHNEGIIQNASSSSMLKLFNLNSGNSGNYSCTAQLYQFEPHSSDSVILEVQFSVKIEISGIQEGDNVTMTCIVPSSEILGYSWLFGNRLLSNTSKVLELSNVSRFISGEYVCQVKTAQGVFNGTEVLNVKYHDTPYFIDLNQKPIEGTNVTFNCSASAYPEAIYTILKNNIVVSNTSLYSISNIQRNDSGEYSCKTKSEISEKMVSQNVTVLYHDTPYFIDLNQKPIGGTNFTFNCFVSAYPEAIYTILKNNIVVSNTSLYSISNIQRNDSGEYSCKTKSGFSEKKVSQNVTVLYHDTPYFIDLNQKPIEGTNVTFNCSASAYPEAIYTILKNNIVVSNTSLYSISNIQRNDSGEYSCKTKSGFSEKNVSQNVTVLYHDTPYFIDLNQEPIEGFNVTFNCSASAYPEAIYTILKNNIVVSNTSLYSISNIQRNDSGEYSCKTKSEISEKMVSQNVTVLYHDTPYFIDLNQKPIEGTKVTFNCSASAYPEAIYTILKNNIVVSNTSLYSISNIQRNDSGEYSCKTKSGFSEKNVSQNVTVLYSPSALVLSRSVNISFAAKVKFSENFSIACSTQDLGYPTAELFWVNGENMNLTSLTLTKNNSITLSITQITRNFTGLYTCIAKNSVLSLNKTFQLFVQEVPDSPKFYSTSSTSTSIFVAWSKPLDRNDPIIGYQLFWQNGNILNYFNTTDTMYTITGLNAFVKYKISVSAFNSIGTSEKDSIEAQTKEAVPNNVQNFQSIPTENSLTISWNAPDQINGILKGYSISYKKKSEMDNYTNECTQIKTNYCVIHDLKPNTEYTVQILVQNELYSNSISYIVSTDLAAPLPYIGELPEVLKDTITKSSFIIKLVRFSDDNGEVKNYTIVVRKLTSDSAPTEGPKLYSNQQILNGADGMYIAGVIYDKTAEFKVGEPSTRKRRSLEAQNPALEPGTYYTVFLRGYVTDQKYQTTGYYHPIKTLDSGISGGTIAAIVVPIVFVLMVIILIILYFHCRRTQSENLPKDITIKNKSFRAISPVGIDRYAPIAPKDFEDHVNRLKANGNYGFSQEYSMINRELVFPYSCSRLPDNNIKNRYHNVPAYDNTRIKLSVIDNDPTSDYINANYIEGYEHEYEYIATQGPLPETVFDFWRMVWETESMTIVMLTRLEEKGRVKCAQYWPESGYLSVKDIVLTATETHEFPDHVVRTFHVTRTGQAVERIVKQFHFTAWPDFGVPNDPSTLLAFIRKVNKWKENNRIQRTIIHCSAGVGRTGTYITIDTQIKQIKKKQEITIFANVSHIREQRCLLVQTEDQYIFIHYALLDYLDSGETEIEAAELREYIRSLSQVVQGSGMTGIMEEFIRLAKSEKKDQFNVANRPVNQAKNRYKNVYPYDDTRVKLSQRTGVDGSDYINANHVDSYACKDFFIATQAPLESTVGDFWRMIWEQRCGTIVMLSKEKESGQVKVYPYWPQKISFKIEHFIIELMTETTFGDYVVRELKLTNTEAGHSFDLKHFQFTTWPDTATPESGFGLIELIGQVQRWNTSINNKCTTVHCSAGVGRTGVFIALTNLIERVKVEGLIDVYQTVKKIRQQRTAMVQTKEQYEFCYRALQEYLDSFDHYANFR